MRNLITNFYLARSIKYNYLDVLLNSNVPVQDEETLLPQQHIEAHVENILELSTDSTEEPPWIPCDESLPTVSLFGPWDAGTHVATVLLRKNLKNCVYDGNKHCDPQWMLEKPDHQLNGCENRQYLRCTNKKHYSVAVMRDPLSMTQSWRQEPHATARCFESNKDDWLDWKKGCMIEPHGTMCYGHRPFKETKLQHPTSPAKLWNRYADGYLKLKKVYTHGHVPVRYENVALAPEKVLREVQKLKGIKFRQEEYKENMVDKDLKGHVDPEASKRAIIEHRYKAEYTDDEYKKMCNDLDLKLVEQWSYDFTLSLCKFIRSGKPPHEARQQVIANIHQRKLERREADENKELKMSELWNMTSVSGEKVSTKPLFEHDFEVAEGKNHHHHHDQHQIDNSTHHHHHHHHHIEKHSEKKEHLTKEQKRGVKRADFMIAHSHDRHHHHH